MLLLHAAAAKSQPRDARMDLQRLRLRIARDEGETISSEEQVRAPAS